MFINVEKLEKRKINLGTEEEKIVEKWIPVSLNLGSIEVFYPENENFTNEVYFILQGAKNTHYRWKFSVEELLEISPIVKNSYYALVRNIKFIEIIENKFYKYNFENENASLIEKIFFKNKIKEIEISKIKVQLLDKPKREIALFQKNIKNNLPQIWLSYIDYQKKALNHNMIFINEVNEINKKATTDAWKSFEFVNTKLEDIKFNRVARKQFKLYFNNQQ